MKTIHRRIAALEKRQAATHLLRQSLARTALGNYLNIEDFLSALGAQREDRPLTEAEAAALHTYQETVKRLHRDAGLHWSATMHDVPDVGHAFAIALGRRIEPRVFELTHQAILAMEGGRVPTDEESDAYRVVAEEVGRLGTLARISAPAESAGKDGQQ